jgi:hypothetical protein
MSYKEPEPIIDNGKVLAQLNKGFFPDRKLGLSTYTGIIKYDFDSEEIDVDAVDEKNAREMIIKILHRDYNPGWSNIEVIHREHGIMYL